MLRYNTSPGPKLLRTEDKIQIMQTSPKMKYVGGNKCVPLPGLRLLSKGIKLVNRRKIQQKKIKPFIITGMISNGKPVAS